MKIPVGSKNQPTGADASIGDEGQDGINLRRIAMGRLIVNLCLFSWLAAVAFGILDTPIGGLFMVGSLIVSLVGVGLLVSEISGTKTSRAFYSVMAIVPLVNLLVMFILSMRAATMLRTAGYYVGLIDAKIALKANSSLHTDA